MIAKSYEELVEGGKKFLDVTTDMEPFEAIEFWFNAMAKVALFGDISLLHKARKELEEYTLNKQSERD